MPRNGAGTASLAEAPFVFDTVISETAVNSDLSDIANMLTASIANDGQTPIVANLPMSGYKHTGVTATSGTSSRTEYASTGTLQDGVPLDAGYTGGTSTAYTATLTPAIAAYADKQCFRVIFNQACGATPTINFNTVGAKKLYKSVGGAATQITTGDIPANFPTDLRYDSTLDAAAGAFWVMDSTGVSAGSIGAEELAASALGFSMVNGTLVPSVDASALTIAVKTFAGTDPSSTDPVKILFRNTTEATGDYTVLSVTSALSLVVSSGSTLGTVSGVPSRLYITCSNDAGTARLGIYNPYNPTGPTLIGLNEGIVYSSTAEGGAGGADSAQTLYTGTAVTSKPLRILGYIESTQATAGTWATSPSKTQLMSLLSNKTGDIVQVQPTYTGTVSTGSTQMVDDNTIPQITEGDEYITRAITPTSAINILQINAKVNGAINSNGGWGLALFQDATADALKGSYVWSGNTVPLAGTLVHTMRAATTSSTTFRVRAGPFQSATFTFNGYGSNQKFGGVMDSCLIAREIFV